MSQSGLDVSGCQRLLYGFIRRCEPAVVADLQDSPGLGSEEAQAARVAERCRERLFQKDMSAVPESATCRLRVECIGNRDVNGVTSVEQFLFRLGQRALQFFGRLLSALPIDVEKTAEFNPAIAAQDLSVHAPHEPAAQNTCPYRHNYLLRVFASWWYLF